MRRLFVLAALLFGFGGQAAAVILVPLDIQPVSSQIEYELTYFGQIQIQLSDSGTDSASITTTFDDGEFLGDVDVSVNVLTSAVTYSLSSQATNLTGGDTRGDPSILSTVVLTLDVPVISGLITPVIVRLNPGASLGTADDAFFRFTDVKAFSSLLGGQEILSIGADERSGSGDQSTMLIALAGDTLSIVIAAEMDLGALFEGQTEFSTNTTAFIDFRTAVIPEPSTACDDALDNDGDGHIDWNGGPLGEPADPGCADDLDVSEKDDTGAYPCDDGADNDSDGRIDFDPVTFANPGDQFTLPSGSGDPGCIDPAGFTENPLCQDGVNNDPTLEDASRFSWTLA
jgi:hypothetical protein